MCLDNWLFPASSDCLVYSFGIGDLAGHWDFEKEYAAFAPNCEIHMFDPTLRPEVAY